MLLYVVNNKHKNVGGFQTQSSGFVNNITWNKPNWKKADITRRAKMKM